VRIGNGQWGGFTAGTQANQTCPFLVDGLGVQDNANATLQINNSGTYIRALKTAFANWTASTNQAQLYGNIQIDVT
jgi:hypothetical protein